eukprot:8408610-Lingulodinium_polyedra.AAC.1
MALTHKDVAHLLQLFAKGKLLWICIAGEHLQVEDICKLKFNPAGWGVLQQPNKDPKWVEEVLPKLVAGIGEREGEQEIYVHNKDEKNTTLQCDVLPEFRVAENTMQFKVYKFQIPRDGLAAFGRVEVFPGVWKYVFQVCAFANLNNV